jgi:hypothetical protein
MLVAIGAVKGFGVTTLAVALAARWPKANAVVNAVIVEADPGGADLAFRFGHHREPGLAELAADARRGAGGVDLAAYAQRLPLGVEVVFGSPAPATPQAVSAVAALVDGGGLDVLRAAARERLVVVDVGRLDWRSPALPIACAADVLLVVTRAGLDGVDAVQVRRNALLALPGLRASVRLVLTGRPFAPPEEISRVVGLPVAALVPDDRRAAAVLTGQAPAGWGWTRLELLRAARALALALQAEFREIEQVNWLAELHAVPPVISRAMGEAVGRR